MKSDPIRHLLLSLGLLTASVAFGQTVSITQTTPDLKHALEAHPAVKFTDKVTAPITIDIDATKRYQVIDGFGASLTDSSSWLLYTKLDEPTRKKAMQSLFDPKQGIGLSFVREPMGASDLAVNHYGYDDMPAGQKDPELKHFSIEHDKAYILPSLRDALALNPQLKVIATPWSPPGWMKTSGSMITGTLLPESYPAFANYFVKFIQAYESAGVPIYGITMQNEPLFEPKDYPGMKFEAEPQRDFLRDHLGPALAKAGLKTKVMVYDHNWLHPEYPVTVLSDPKAAQYAAGTAFHCYEGEVGGQAVVHDKFPQKDLWETECSGGTWQKEDPLKLTMQLIIGSTRNWAKSVVLWGMALDPNGNPHAGGCGTCRGVVTVDYSSTPAKFTPTADYYALGHASKFVKPGAVRIDSTDTTSTGLQNVAFRNEDGSIALLLLNASTEPKQFAVKSGGKAFSYTLAPGAVATLVW